MNTLTPKYWLLGLLRMEVNMRKIIVFGLIFGLIGCGSEITLLENEQMDGSTVVLPELRSVDLLEDHYFTHTTLEAQVLIWPDAEIQDPDLDISWYVDNEVVEGEKDVSLPTEFFVKENTVYVMVIPSKNGVIGEAVYSRAVTIENHLAEITEARYVNDEPTYSEGVTVVAEYFDADGDAAKLSAVWLVNGENANIHTLEFSNYTTGDEVQAVAYVEQEGGSRRIKILPEITILAD